jgi:hypothetical protein
MTTWIKCTTMEGAEIRLNMDHVVLVRSHRGDRGGTGSEVVFAGGTPSSIIVKEDQNYLTVTPPVAR